MNGADPSAAACLKVLLEDQAWHLTVLLGHLAAAVGDGLRVVPPQQWAGPARQAHDDFVRRMTTQIDAARTSIERASAESTRAAATLASRV